MGGNTSKINQHNDRAIGTLLRLPEVQDNLKIVYKHLHPTANQAKVRAFVKTLNSQTTIQNTIESFELQVYGRNADGSAKVHKGNDLYQRALDLKNQVKLQTIIV
jgi:hypothetical protein